jgi:hypothetical protein
VGWVPYGGHSPCGSLVEQVATTGVKETALELAAEVPLAADDVEVPAGGSAGLCVEEHPASAKITAPVIATTTVRPGRDRLVMGDCLSLAHQALTVRYGTGASAPPSLASRPVCAHRVYHSATYRFS